MNTLIQQFIDENGATGITTVDAVLNRIEKITGVTRDRKNFDKFVSTILVTWDTYQLIYGPNDHMRNIEREYSDDSITVHGRKESPVYALAETLECGELDYLAYKLAPLCHRTPRSLLIETYFDADVQRTGLVQHGFEAVIPLFIGRVCNELRAQRGWTPVKKVPYACYFGQKPHVLPYDIRDVLTEEELSDNTWLEAYSWIMQRHDLGDVYDIDDAHDAVSYTHDNMCDELKHLFDEDYGNIKLADLLSQQELRKFSAVAVRNKYFEDKSIGNSATIEEAVSKYFT